MPTKEQQSTLGRLSAIILGVATLAGVPAAVIAFWPRVTVVPSGLFDESNAYSEIFTITNTGFFAFEDMRIGIGICSVDTAKHDFYVTPNNCDETGPHVRLGLPKWDTPELRREETFSIVLTDVITVATEEWKAAHPNVILSMQIASELRAANIIVAVNFEPWPLIQRIEKRYRFVAEEQPNGKMMWHAVPLSWKDIKLP